MCDENNDKDISKTELEILLKEYEFTQNAYNDMGHYKWQLAGMFSVISIGGISILLTLSNHDLSNLIMVIGVSLVSISILFIWLGIVKRWQGIQDVQMYRMKEIEKKVGFQRLKYIELLEKKKRFEKFHSTEDEKKAIILDKEITNFSKISIRKNFNFLIVILVTSWVIMIIREIILFILGAFTN